MINLEQIKKNTIAKFFFVDLIVKGVGVLFIPVFALLLGATELGKFSEWLSFYNIMFAIISLGIPSYILVKSAKGDFEINIEKGILRTFLEWFSIIAIFLFICALAIGDLDENEYLFSLVFAGFMFFFVEFFNSKCRLSNDALTYFKVQVLGLFSSIIIPVIFVIFWPFYYSRVIGFIFGTAIVSFYCCYRIFNSSNEVATGLLNASQNRIRLETLKYGLPLVVVGLVSWLKIGVDIQFLKHVSDYKAIGSMALVSQMLTVVTITAASLNRASSTEFYKLLEAGQSFFWIKLVFKLSILVSCVGLLTLIALYVLSLFYLAEYENVMIFYFPMLAGVIMYTAGQFYASKLLYFENTKALSIALIFSSLLHPIVSYFIVHTIGYKYIGFSHMISSLLFLLLIFYFVKINGE